MSTEDRHQYGQENDGLDADNSPPDVVDHAAAPETVEEAGRLVPRSAADGTGKTFTDEVDMDDAAKSEDDAKETFEDEPTADESVAELTPEQLAAAARMSGISTDRDALVAVSDGTITRGDARDWLYAHPGKS